MGLELISYYQAHQNFPKDRQYVVVLHRYQREFAA